MRFLPLLLAAAVPAHAAPPPAVATFARDHCASCHDANTRKGGFDLDALGWGDDPASHAKWVRAFDRVAAGEMPPKGKPGPTADERKTFIAALGKGLTDQHAAGKGTVLRRLNRTEYENTLRDLLGVRVHVRNLLPEDSLAHGFDNVGEALGLSDVQMRQYLEAAGVAIDEVLARTAKPVTKKDAYSIGNTFNVTKPGKLEPGKGDRNALVRADGTVVVFHSGRYPSIAPQTFKAAGDERGNEFRAAVEGRYRITVRGSAFQSPEPVVFAVRAGTFGLADMGAVVAVGEFAAEPATLEVVATLAQGERIRLFPELAMDYAAMQQKGPFDYPGPGLAVSAIEVEGPLPTDWPPRGQVLLFGDLPTTTKYNGRRQALVAASKDPAGDAAKRLRAFAAAAFRRPVTDEKVTPYVALFRTVHARGGDFTAALRAAAVAVLCSPDFLYLAEPAGKLDDFALAARLSYFLTRTMPDDALLAKAAAGKLTDPAVLRGETERLLKNPDAARFYADFTDAWLNLREIEFTNPDARLYPEFDESLQWSMVAETRGFLRELVESNLSPANVVKSDFAMLNGRLAKHYGLPPVAGGDVRKVTLPANSRRGGFLTQGAVLKVSANGTNTSPVVRGAYVLDRILGTPPLPPPPGVPGVEPDTRGAKTLRELLAAHRQLESCNSCHASIDPPGFALESYDVIGGWRDRFRTQGGTEVVTVKLYGRTFRYRLGPPVDASGTLPDGREFQDFAGFQDLLLADPNRVTKALTEKLLTFAAGREPGFSDRAEIDRMVNRLAADKGGVRDLLHAVVQSDYFRTK